MGLSSVLFVSAHGSPLILPLYFLAVGAAVMRRTKTLSFTMAAHAAWTLAVICMAAFVLFSPSKVFSPADGAYTVNQPPSWQRMEGAEEQLPNGSLDLALQADNGSFLAVERVEVTAGAPASNVVTMMPRLIQGSGFPFAAGQGPHRSGAVSGAWELEGKISSAQGAGSMRALALLPPGQSRAIVFIFVCPEAACPTSAPGFDRFLSAFHRSSV